MTESWQTGLARNGYFQFSREQSCRTALSAIISELRPRKIECSRLKAQTTECAYPNSLSSRYGLGEQPLHTDRAGLIDPPRYVILAAPPWRMAPTKLLDLHPLLDTLPLNLQRSLFRIRYKNSAYLYRFCQRRSGCCMMRFNTDIMEPVDEFASIVVRFIKEMGLNAHSVLWNQTAFLVFDNWRIIHGRGDVSVSSRMFVRRMHIWN